MAYGKKSSFKYLIGYNDDDVIRPLCIKLPQMIGYIKYFDSNKSVSFMVTDKKTMKKVYQNMEQSQQFNE